jgi:uncharacterized OB-fold protein
LNAPTEFVLHSSPLSEGVAEGRLLRQRCASCGCVPSYPRIACPNCFEPLEWIEASGAGTIRTFSVLQRTHSHKYEQNLPIVLVRVALAEGGELISTLVGEDRLDAEIGAAVRFAVSEGWSTLPQFRLLLGTAA